MNTYLRNKRIHPIYRILSAFIVLSFAFTSVVPVGFAQVSPQAILNVPVSGGILPVSTGFTPPLIKGITIYPEDAMQFGFIVDPGDTEMKGDILKAQSRKLIKYFLASLTVPEDQLWVNLSPYEQGRIISEGLGQTEMGRDMLAQDYLLKQLTASLMYPEEDLGKEFWNRVYKKAYAKYGTTDIPMNTFNKIWIIPESATVLVSQDRLTAYVAESNLKVMLEEDYVALEKNADNTKFGMDTVKKEDAKVISGVSSEVIREILIPEIEKEVNEGKTFSNLRQIFNSLILAVWYKKNLSESLLGQAYMDQNKTKGIDLKDKTVNQEIYKQYTEIFKNGVYDYIREEYDPVSDTLIPRKYFSGGVLVGNFGAVGLNEVPISQASSAIVGGIGGKNPFSVITRLQDFGEEGIEYVKRYQAAASPVSGAEKILQALTPNQRKMVTKERMSDTNDDLVAKAEAAGLDNERAQIWAAHVAEVRGFKDGKFVVVTENNIEELKELARKKKILTDVGNGTDVANSHPDDVQRVPKRTGTVLTNPAEAGKFNNRKEPEVLSTVLSGYEGSMTGSADEVLYIIPYMMEPKDGLPWGGYFGKPSIHITDDLYVAIGVPLMVKHTGRVAMDRINEEGDFFMALTNPGDLEQVKREGDILLVDKSTGDFEKVVREGEYAIYDGDDIQLLSVFEVKEGKAVRKVYTDQADIAEAIDQRLHGLDKHVVQIKLVPNQELHIVTAQEDERHILAVPELDLGISIGTAFGGNAFINKKVETLKIGNHRTVEALGDGIYKIVAHMAIVEYTDPDLVDTEEETVVFGYEGPSNSGKTAFSTQDSPNVKTLSDDLANIALNMNTGEAVFAQPEGAIFAVMRNTNAQTNDRILKAVGPGTGTIFTNMGFNPTLPNPNDRVWWGGLTPTYPHSIEGLRDYRNVLVTDRVVTQAHVDVDSRFQGRDLDSLSEKELNAIKLTMMDIDHANGRGTTRLENLPGLSPNVNKWVPLNGIIFGGRMEQPGKIPLITHLTDLGQVMHQRMFNMQVQETAAEQGAKVGAFKIESRANNPFFGVRLSTDANHQLAFWNKQWELSKQKGKKPVEFFQGNWIHPKIFELEGFQFPEDVLRWASQQIRGVQNYETTPIGNIPSQGAFDLSRFKIITQEKVDQVRIPDLEEAKNNLVAAWNFAMSEDGADQELDAAFYDAHNQLRANLGMPAIASSPLEAAVISSVDDIIQISEQTSTPFGGIDFNPEYMDMQILRDERGIPLPLPQQPITTMHIEGIIPVIIDIIPVNIPMLLGLANSEGQSAGINFNDINPADRKARFDSDKDKDNDKISWLN